MSQQGMKPFVKWAGGKQRLVPELLKYVPENFHSYHEPFVGGGALYFALMPHGKPAHLYDACLPLVTAWEVVQDHVDELIATLSGLQRQIDGRDDDARKELYYAGRKRLNSLLEWPGHYSTSEKVMMAAWFLFINRMGYNGLWRVNRKGLCNVPFGRYAHPKVLHEEVLHQCSGLLSLGTRAEIHRGDFGRVEEFATVDDFVYFDPPYVPVSETADFTAFTAGGFGMDQQERLAALAERLVKHGATVVLSNADTPWVRERYKSFEQHQVFVPRAINSKGNKRGGVPELIIVGKPA